MSAPACKSHHVSRENVEKVVSPPKKPMITISRHSAGNMPRSTISTKHSPANNEPSTLTSKVPKGKPPPNKRSAPSDRINRHTAPNAPPSATAINCCMLVYCPPCYNTLYKITAFCKATCCPSCRARANLPIKSLCAGRPFLRHSAQGQSPQMRNPVGVDNKGMMLLVLLDSAIVLAHNAE